MEWRVDYLWGWQCDKIVMWRMTCERVTYCDMKNKFVDSEAILLVNTFSILPHFIQSWCPYLRSMENPHLEMTDKESQRANSLSRWIIGGFLVNNSSRWSGNLNLNFNSTLLQNSFSYFRGSPNPQQWTCCWAKGRQVCLSLSKYTSEIILMSHESLHRT